METNLIVCPVCGFDHSHHKSVTIYERFSGEDKPTWALNSDEGTWKPSTYNPSGRRNAVAIHFYGECGHEWSLEFIQHKGQTLIHTRITKGKE